MEFPGALSGLLKILSLNSIMQQEIHDRIVYCDRLEEEGFIHLQVRKGIIPLPLLIPFNMPSNSGISEFQDNEEVFEFFAKIERDEKRNIQRGFLDFSKITFHPRIQGFPIRYKRIVDIKSISSLVKVGKEGEEVIVENKSNTKIIKYKVIVRMHLSFYLRDILDFDERRLEIYKKEYMRENIKVNDDRGTIIKASLERLYQKNGIRLEGDISWLTDINPNERKIFKIFVSDHAPNL